MTWLQISDDYDVVVVFGSPGFLFPQDDPPYELLDVVTRSGVVDTMREARSWIENAEVFTHTGADRTTWTYIADGEVDIELLNW